MSTNTVQRTTKGENEVASKVETIFERIAQSGKQLRLRQITGVCEFDIAPLGSWYVRMKDGIAHVTREPAATPPRCVVSCAATDFLDVVTRKDNLNVGAALLQERVTITGDFPFGFALLSGFAFVPRERSRHVEE